MQDVIKLSQPLAEPCANDKRESHEGKGFFPDVLKLLYGPLPAGYPTVYFPHGGEVNHAFRDRFGLDLRGNLCSLGARRARRLLGFGRLGGGGRRVGGGFGGAVLSCHVLAFLPCFLVGLGGGPMRWRRSCTGGRIAPALFAAVVGGG